MHHQLKAQHTTTPCPHTHPPLAALPTHCPAHSLAHDGDWLVAGVPLGVVEALDELQETCGAGGAVVLWPLLVLQLGHHKPLPWGALSLEGGREGRGGEGR